jgi:hypothetical protein
MFSSLLNFGKKIEKQETVASVAILPVDNSPIQSTSSSPAISRRSSRSFFEGFFQPEAEDNQVTREFLMVSHMR